jgi:hypothetical protein
MLKEIVLVPAGLLLVLTLFLLWYVTPVDGLSWYNLNATDRVERAMKELDAGTAGCGKVLAENERLLIRTVALENRRYTILFHGPKKTRAGVADNRSESQVPRFFVSVRPQRACNEISVYETL